MGVLFLVWQNNFFNSKRTFSSVGPNSQLHLMVLITHKLGIIWVDRLSSYYLVTHTVSRAKKITHILKTYLLFFLSQSGCTRTSTSHNTLIIHTVYRHTHCSSFYTFYPSLIYLILLAVPTVWSHVLRLSLSLSLRTNLVWRSALLLLLTAFPWGEAVNLQAMCAVISAPSASVGSSELCVTAEWATLAAEHPAAACPSSELSDQLKKQNKLHAKSKPLEVNTERWITPSPRFATLPPKFTAWKHFITEDCTTMNFPKTLQGVLLILKHCNDDLSYVFILLWASSMH